MLGKQRTKKYRDYLHGELKAAAVYQALGDSEKDPKKSEILYRLAKSEMRHASMWARRLSIDPSSLKTNSPGIQLKILQMAARRFGTGKIVPLLLRGEDRDIRAYSIDPEAHPLVEEERSHNRTLR